MNVAVFKQAINEMVNERIGLTEFASYLKHESREDKQLREEMLAVSAIVKHRALDDDAEIEIGGEKHSYDACVAGELIEITQALPKYEHEIRKAIATGPTTPSQYIKHARDQFQFPDALIEAINKKHTKHYADTRTLVVVLDGDYSYEEDSIIEGWIAEIRQKTNRGSFQYVLLVERGRMKAFDVF